MSNRDRVRLDRLNGFEFEKFCALVFERLNFGRVENLPSVGDKGRDLIIHGAKKIVVECKHHPAAAIGRPVVQKLHSAVISERASEGWLVTSGRFSNQAVKHAEEITRSGVGIKLVDRAMLTDMAHRANIDVIGKFDQPVVAVEPPDLEYLSRAVKSEISPRLSRIPSRDSPIDSILIGRITVVPVISAQYDANQEWFVGEKFGKRLLHEVHISGESLLLDSNKRTPVDSITRDFLNDAPTTSDTDWFGSISGMEDQIERLSSESSLQQVRDVIVDTIRREHSRRVLHEATNGRKYWRQCIVSDRNIFVRTVTTVLLPRWTIECRVAESSYTVTCLAHSSNVVIVESNLFTCRHCHKEIQGIAVLCDSCGKVTHARNLFRRHATKCSSCGRTLCMECVIRRRFFWPFERTYCNDCS